MSLRWWTPHFVIERGLIQPSLLLVRLPYLASSPKEKCEWENVLSELSTFLHCYFTMLLSFRMGDSIRENTKHYRIIEHNISKVVTPYLHNTLSNGPCSVLLLVFPLHRVATWQWWSGWWERLMEWWRVDSSAMEAE